MFFQDEEALSFRLSLGASFNFTCQRCGACCYQRRISLNEYEINRLALHLGLDPDEFVSRYLNLESPPSIKNREDGSCIFLANRLCRVHPVRPLVCRLYPLGLLVGPNNEVKWGLMPLHPDCLGLVTLERTVAAYLESQGAFPYLDFELRQLSLSK